MSNRGFWFVAALAIGLLQAWDSNTLEAGAFEQLLIGAALLLPAASIAAPVDHGFRLGALAAGAALLTWARIASPVQMNTLHLALFPAALYILFVHNFMGRRA